ncbi:MAG: peptidylprolyl isomerase [Desulfobacterales bacterium]|jgi:peptidylprolyl isomerase|nr:peptidylprolyl isomerase [Desulfobacteraceae bacterium]MBT7087113.1 peptidylprolyl isomerase [Desulfobacterales bacterium]MBT7698100.1 peptidylprolyl isomerase [Desulfobacterales bacterium]
MEKVENGMFVSVEYKGTLKNGEMFDTSEGRQPLEVAMGAGQMIKGFEAELLDLSLNDKKTFTISPEEAYGQRDENQMHSFDRSEVPPEMNPQIGQTIALSSPDGQQIPAMISQVDDEKVTVDLNHPLAGESLTFEIEVVGISNTPTQSQEGCGCDSGCDTEAGGDCSSGGCSSGGCS